MMLQYLVVQSDDLSPHEARHRVEHFVDAFNRDVKRYWRPGCLPGAVREVELLCEPVRVFRVDPAGSISYDVAGGPDHFNRHVSLHSHPLAHHVVPGPVYNYYTSRYLPLAYRAPRRSRSVVPRSHTVYRSSAPRVKIHSSLDDCDTWRYPYSTDSPSLHHHHHHDGSYDRLLSYEVPSQNNVYHNMRDSLSKVNQKMLEHKRLLDRYSSVDLNEPATPVDHVINERYEQVAERVPRLKKKRYGKPRVHFQEPEIIKCRSASVDLPRESTVQLRGRIKQLLNKTRTVE